MSHRKSRTPPAGPGYDDFVNANVMTAVSWSSIGTKNMYSRQRRPGLVEQRAQVVVILHVKARKDRIGVARLDPDGAETLLRFVRFCSGVQLRRAGAFAVAGAVVGPAVIAALQAMIDDAAVT